MNFTEAAHVIEIFRTQTSKDVYSKWHVDNSQWQTESVKTAFDEVKHFIQTELMKEDLRSCIELDLKLINLMERHVSEGMSISHFQAVFVALIVEALNLKKHDDYARKHVSILTHGYRSQLLSFFLSEILRDGMVDFVIATYKDEQSRYGILSFFEV